MAGGGVQTRVRRRAADRAGRWAAWLGGALVVAFVVLPIWYMLVSSLDPDPVGAGTGLLPHRFTLDNYRFLGAPHAGFYPALARTLLLSGVTTLAALLVAVPAAYALARLSVPGARQVLVGMLTLVFFPGVLLLVPMQKTFSSLGWIDTLPAIGLAQLSFALPLAVWFLAAAFGEVPPEVEEAAMLDGAGVLRRIAGVVVPMSRPGVAATTALVFVFSWNDFLFSSSLSLTHRSETVSVLLSKLPVLGFLGVQMAAAVAVAAPVALLIAGLQRWLVGHVTVRDQP